MKISLTVLIAVILCIGLPSLAQNNPEVLQGDKLFDAFEYKEALFFYESAHEASPTEPGITRKIANTYRRMGELSMSAEWYRRTLETDSSRSEDLLYYAEALKSIGEYEAALEWYEKYQAKNPSDKRAKSHLKDPFYFEDLGMDSLKYEMKRLNINNTDPAIGICLFEDEKYIIAAVNVDQGGPNSDRAADLLPYLDLFLCAIDGERELHSPVRLPSQVNSKYHDGPAFFSFRDRKLYITRNNVKNGKPVRDNNGSVNLKIYESTFNGTSWSNAQELRFNSDAFSNGHPCLSKDGNTMYFVSNRPDGFGGTDIYMCTKLGGEWSEPSNLGSQINTEGNEMFPFLSEEGKLYFSSDGHAGLGGLDIFYAVKKDGTWSTPVNMGSPVNSNHDDFSMVYDSERESGYFCSDRSGSGNDDLFGFRVIQLEKMILAGTIRSSLPQVSLANEKIMIRSSLRNEPIAAQLDENGDFVYHAQPGEKIEVFLTNVEFFNADSALFVKEVSNPIEDPFVNLGEAVADFSKLPPVGTGTLAALVEQSIQNPRPGLAENIRRQAPPVLDPTDTRGQIVPEDRTALNQIGTKPDAQKAVATTTLQETAAMPAESQKIALPGRHTVYFDFNKSLVKNEARTTLDEIIAAMKADKSLNVMIETHCDSRGKDDYNTILSRDRAYAVKKYFMRNGISVRRIGIDWSGENQLANHCKNGVKCTAQEHKANRRAEITLTNDRIAQFPSK